MREISILKELQPHPNIVRYFVPNPASTKWSTCPVRRNCILSSNTLTTT